MKRLALSALVLLAACATPATLPPPPAAVAERTVLDEQAAIGVELAYKAVRVALESAVGAGLIRGDNAVRVAALDNKAYRLVLAVRAAYRAGNATGYLEAAHQAHAALEQTLTAIRGK